MSERDYCDRAEAARTPTDSEIEITEFGGIRVAYLPGEDDAWISGWVDVPL